jgi:Electron transfer DM13
VFTQNAYFFASVLSIILIFSSTVYPFSNLNTFGQAPASHISSEQYDKIKNCTTDLSKKPTSIEYLTYFNCGHVSKDESGRTVRQFTLIVQENLKATNGPDLYVYLSTDKGVSDFVNLGRLKGNIGNQNYEIPAGTDPAKYDTVLIWCKAFSTLFGSAKLSS